MIFCRETAIVNSMRHADAIEQKVKTFIDKHLMIAPGDRVVVGVSGGADSVCLLFVLLAWMEEIPFSLQVVHVNHGIRPEAGDDAAYVEELCISHGIPFTLVEKDVRKLAKEQKRSEEEMGRLVRYEAFEEIMKQTGAQRIAVAHNSNDLAETMLFHLFRGSGLSGLCGIRPVRNQIIRPILCLERREIEAYLKGKGIRYCQDATNEGDDYTRNRIRHHILPYAEKEIVQGCVGHMAQTADMLLETEEYLERLTRKAWEEAVEEVTRFKPGGQSSAKDSRPTVTFAIDCSVYDTLDPLIGKRLLYRVLGRLSPGGRDITYVHVRDVEELFAREGNRSICLPYGIRARRQYGQVWLIRQEQPKTQERSKAIQVPLDCPQAEESTTYALDREELLGNGVQILVEDMGTLHFQVFSSKNFKDIPQNRYTKWFDYDKIEGLLTVRTRQTGDFLTIRAANGEQIHKSLKDYMVTEKIPRQDRDRIPLIAQDHHVLWLVGYRISEHYKISENTKRILQVQLRRDCDCSEMEEHNGRTCESTVD